MAKNCHPMNQPQPRHCQNSRKMLEKYYPIVANIHLLAVHLLWEWFRFDLRPFTAVLFGFSVLPWLILYGYSKKHHFCLWHRVLLLNLLLHGILYFANNTLFSLGYEMLHIFYVTLYLTVIALITATALYFWTYISAIVIKIWDGRFTSSKKRIKAGKP